MNGNLQISFTSFLNRNEFFPILLLSVTSILEKMQVLILTLRALAFTRKLVNRFPLSCLFRIRLKSAIDGLKGELWQPVACLAPRSGTSPLAGGDVNLDLLQTFLLS